MSQTTLSHHLLRRTARAKAIRLSMEAQGTTTHYRVVKARRGPWRYRVVRITATD